MVDFAKLKLLTPEEREEARLKLDARLKAEEQRTRLMVDKLEDQVDRGFINNAFVESFISSVKQRLMLNLPLTDKQTKKLEELFEQY